MKKLPCILLASSILIASSASGAQTAQVRMYCLSLKVNPGMDEYGDIMTLTTTGSMDAGTNELAAAQTWGVDLQLPTTEAYSSSMFLYDSYSGQTFGGYVNIDIQPHTDDNGNRFPDFFEVSRGISNYYWPFGMVDVYGWQTYYNVGVTWNRAAGSRNGTCVIHIGDGYFGTFHHTFQILEYTGTLTYTPGVNTVSGTLNLTQTGNPASSVQGSVQFTKSDVDPYNQLILQAGSLTGTMLSTVHSFTNHLFTRDILWPSNYAGFVEFSDGDPFTFEPYANWVLSITDTNDSNHNGIPDFADDPAILPPARRPGLALVRGSGSLQLIIQGDVGHAHQVQEAVSLSSPAWNTVSNLTLNADPQTISLPVPSGTKFWRVVAQ